MDFINGATLLLLYELAGEVIVLILPTPIPGPVVGMLLLFLTLLLRKRPNVALETASDTLLSHLSLLFIPAGVGIMVHFERLSQEWLSICVALIVSTLITMAVTAAVMKKVLQLLGEENYG